MCTCEQMRMCKSGHMHAGAGAQVEGRDLVLVARRVDGLNSTTRGRHGTKEDICDAEGLNRRLARMQHSPHLWIVEERREIEWDSCERDNHDGVSCSSSNSCDESKLPG